MKVNFSIPATIRTVILYGVAMAVLTGLLKFVEYRYYIREYSPAIFTGIIAVMFTGIGVWAGLRLTRPKLIEKIIEKNDPLAAGDDNLARLGISKREYEVLQLVSLGLSNHEIADKLYVSLSTVKTHVSSLLAKLDASRRTQLIRRARELRILR